MRCLTATSVALLALLALSQLAMPVEASGRTLLKKKKKNKKGGGGKHSEKDAQALAEQQKQLEELVSGQAQRDQAALDEQARRQGQTEEAAMAKALKKAKKDKKKGRKGRKSTTEDFSTMGAADTGAAAAGGSPKKSKISSDGAVRATYHYYDDSGNGDGSPISATSCADEIKGSPGRYWTAYCGNIGGMDDSKCGKCIRITNVATGASVEATVVDTCGTGGVDMDPSAFNKIDTDGAGMRDGAMMVKLSWC